MSNTAQTQAGKRILSLLDQGSFVEIGGRVTARNTDFNLQNKELPSDGVITGYGTINESLVYVYSQDASVLGGSIGEMHAKKIVKIYDLAMKTGAPVIGLIDCAGLRIQEATDALNAFGEVYMSQVSASGAVPQITAIFGTCGGGLALVPALTDFTFMEEKKAKLFVNSPNTLDGNIISKCDTSAADFQAKEAGLVDGVGTEDDVIAQIRTLISILPSNYEDDMSYTECTDDLNRLCDGIEAGAKDAAYVLSVISDDNFFFETKKEYAKEMVTGFIRINGATIGAVANRSERFGTDDAVEQEIEKFDTTLTAQGCEKAAAFVRFCDSFGIPVLSLTATTGFAATKCQEKKIAKAAAALASAFADATVPKVNIVIGPAYGTAYNVMNSKALGADLVYAWPQASIGLMDAKAAVKIMYADEIAQGNGADVIAKRSAEYEALQNGAVSAAKRGYVDDIIEPVETRQYVAAAYELLFTKREDRPAKKHGAR
ncbi:MAG: carboxyl transferase [Lachnospiraceae bacterium]|nr:carboxyl transferase [Lachnospiraceae bacterium]